MTTESLDPRCARVRARLPEQLDGALVPLEEARDQGHLEACAACAREAQAYARTLAGVRTLARGGQRELAAVHAAILAGLEPRPRREPREWRFALAAAAALVLFTLGSWFGLPRTPRPEDLSHLDVLSDLPDWAGLLRGLEDLTRPFS